MTAVDRPDIFEATYERADTPVIPGQNPGKPTAEAVADALIQYETGGMCHYGQTCGLCDCGRSDQTPERQRGWDELQLDRARAVLAVIPAAVLKPIRELHREQFQFCRDCDADYPCPTIQLCDAIESSAKGGDS